MPYWGSRNCGYGYHFKTSENVNVIISKQMGFTVNSLTINRKQYD